MASGPPAKHFKKISQKDIKEIGEEYKNVNTKANEKKAVKNFKMFLKFNGEAINKTLLIHNIKKETVVVT